jgi:hypothetical protein
MESVGAVTAVIRAELVVDLISSVGHLWTLNAELVQSFQAAWS